MIKSAIKKIIKRFRDAELKRFILASKNPPEQYKLSKKQKRFCFKHGFSYTEYAMLQLDKNDYNQYLSTLDSYIPRFKINDSEFLIISDNKLLTPMIFGGKFFMATNVAYLDKGIVFLLDDINSNDDFISYIKSNEVIIKPIDGSDGDSICDVKYLDDDVFLMNDKQIKSNELINEILKLKKYLVQTKIKPHNYSKNIFPHSINTIRVISYAKEKYAGHEIICAVHRFGTNLSKPADNFAVGGISAPIDINTGIIGKASGAYTFDAHHNRIYYSQHPNTGSPIEGIKIPFWEKIKDTIYLSTRKIPFLRFVAWDIVITDDGRIGLIEINTKSTLNVFQVHKPMKNSKLGEILREW